jgi:hypothetical protein
MALNFGPVDAVAPSQNTQTTTRAYAPPDEKLSPLK